MKTLKELELKRIFTRPIIYIYLGVFVLIGTLIALHENKNQVKTDVVVRADPFSNLEIRAKAAYVFDISENRMIFEKNAHTPLPLASITKLMTVHCALIHNDRKKIVTVPDRVYAYYDNATSTGASESWTLENLAIYTLINSSNAGAQTLAQSMGGEEDAIRCMNDESIKMNLSEASFNSVTGLDIDATTAGSYGSAENVAFMFQHIFLAHEDIIEKTSYSSYEIRSIDGKIHIAKNTNLAARNLVGFLGSKTGLTDIAGGNLTFIMDVGLNHKIVVAILGSTETERFSDALLINKAVIESLYK